MNDAPRQELDGPAVTIACDCGWSFEWTPEVLVQQLQQGAKIVCQVCQKTIVLEEALVAAPMALLLEVAREHGGWTEARRKMVESLVEKTGELRGEDGQPFDDGGVGEVYDKLLTVKGMTTERAVGLTQAVMMGRLVRVQPPLWFGPVSSDPRLFTAHGGRWEGEGDGGAGGVDPTLQALPRCATCNGFPQAAGYNDQGHPEYACGCGRLRVMLMGTVDLEE